MISIRGKHPVRISANLKQHSQLISDFRVVFGQLPDELALWVWRAKIVRFAEGVFETFQKRPIHRKPAISICDWSNFHKCVCRDQFVSKKWKMRQASVSSRCASQALQKAHFL